MISIDKKYQIALNCAFRHYKILTHHYLSDVKQECYVIIYSQVYKNETLNELRRRADRHFYVMSKNYNLKRFYVSGNKKSSLSPVEVQVNEFH